MSRNRKRVLTNVVILVIAYSALIRGCREFGGSTSISLGYYDTFISPQGTKLRVVITSQGALGWGRIKFYRYSRLTGYSFVSSPSRAVAEEGARVHWTGAASCEVTFLDPDFRDPCEQFITVALDLR